MNEHQTVAEMEARGGVKQKIYSYIHHKPLYAFCHQFGFSSVKEGKPLEEEDNDNI